MTTDSTRAILSRRRSFDPGAELCTFQLQKPNRQRELCGALKLWDFSSTSMLFANENFPVLLASLCSSFTAWCETFYA
jgi:hypothetical protein